jgi:arylsulfatase A-like enzyme
MRCAFYPLVLVLSLLLNATGSARHHEQWNIIFILTDDQRQDTLGCTGNQIVQTPNLDQLASEGTLFTQATVTSAICTPSRASYFSGTHERHHGINFNSGTAMSPAAWEQCYPMLLKHAGYFTGYVGKNHVPVGGDGYDSGLIEATFDYWYGGHGHLGFYPKERKPGQIKLKGIGEQMFDNAAANTQVEILEEGALNFLNPNKDFYDNAARFLRERPDDRPFCLTIAFNLPHDAGTKSMEQRPSDRELYKSGYRDQEGAILEDLPETYTAKAEIQAPKLPKDILLAELRQHGYDYVDTPETLVERIIRRYQAIEGIDQLIGNLRRQLERLHLSEKTIVIFSSDHGIFRGEFGLGGKSMNYDPCLRVPLIVYDPSSESHGQRRVEAVQSIDVTATILDYAGVKAPAHMTGVSMKPLVHGEEIQWRDYTFSEALWCTAFGMPRIESVRGKGWKYIRYFKVDRGLFDPMAKGMEKYLVSDAQADAYQSWLTSSIAGEKPDYEELYHLETDPNETKNLIDAPDYHDRADILRKICQELVEDARSHPYPLVQLESQRSDYHRWKLVHE